MAGSCEIIFREGWRQWQKVAFRIPPAGRHHAISSRGSIRFAMSTRNHPMNDNDQRPVTIITGRVRRRKGGRSAGVHIMLVAPDDDTAVRTALESLTREGFVEAELDQIGDVQDVPDEEPHLSAYQGALEGEVSIVTFDEVD
jgi:hypothetical protein